MQIIISPAKKMKEDTDSFPNCGLPVFLDRAEELLQLLREMDYDQLKKLWGCSDALVKLNMERIRTMAPAHAKTPAIISYEGIQYQYMAPGVFSKAALDYIQDHLRILSGFYGVLKPFDAVTPYRLEMQAKLQNSKGETLYDYWNNNISDALYAESDCVLNLASQEYSICVSRNQPVDTRLITCMFTERKGNKLIEKGTLCKMARGDMVRFLAEHQITDSEGVKQYDGMGYRFSEADSDPNTFIFIKEDSTC